MPKMILQNVRGSFVFVTQPRKKENGEAGNYGIQVIISKKDPQVKKFNKLVDQALEEKHGSQAL